VGVTRSINGDVEGRPHPGFDRGATGNRRVIVMVAPGEAYSGSFLTGRHSRSLDPETDCGEPANRLAHSDGPSGTWSRVAHTLRMPQLLENVNAPSADFFANSPELSAPLADKIFQKK
jgi:hypothetical protein